MLEQLLLGLKIMVLGLAAVFAGLILLIFVIELLHKAVGSERKKDEKQPAPIEKPFESVDKIEESGISEQKGDSEDDELIAVISAAVAAALNRSTHDIIVRSVRRIESHSPAWNRISRQEQIRSRF